MFPTMDRFGTAFVALGAMGAASLGSPRRATGQADVWSPRTAIFWNEPAASEMDEGRSGAADYQR